jgi:hypothetical protein
MLTAAFVCSFRHFEFPTYFKYMSKYLSCCEYAQRVLVSKYWQMAWLEFHADFYFFCLPFLVMSMSDAVSFGRWLLKCEKHISICLFIISCSPHSNLLYLARPGTQNNKNKRRRKFNKCFSCLFANFLAIVCVCVSLKITNYFMDVKWHKWHTICVRVVFLIKINAKRTWVN